MNYQKIAADVLEAIGGKENMSSFAHCATRLRIMVIDESKIDKKKVDHIEGAKGAFLNSGQFQIIFGTGTVNKVHEAMSNLGVQTSTKEEIKEEAAKKGNLFKRAIRIFGDVFVPIIPVLVATGLFMGLRGLLTQPQVLSVFQLSPSDINQNFLLWTQVLTDTAFAFLPALVCWSTFKVFKGSPVLGIVLGLMLVNPALPNAYAIASGSETPIMMMGFIPVVGYQGTVLPAFFAGILGAHLERKLRKRIPDALDLLITPFATLLIMSVLSLFIIGPVFHSLETVVLKATEAILNLPFGLSGIIIGGLQQLIVVTGIHHIFNFLEVQLLSNYGANAFNALLSAATAAQAGATLAVGVKTKDAKIKSLAFPSAFSASLGITEPAIFGVNLRFVKPFLFALVGGACGGFAASLFQLAGTGMSVTVIPGIFLYLNHQLPFYLLSLVISAAVAFILTYLFGYSDDMLSKQEL